MLEITIQNRKENLSFWKNQPNGMITDQNVLKGIREHSESLDTLYRKGFDFKSIYKFSSREKHISVLIGEIFFLDYRIIEGIKKIMVNNEPVGRIRVKGELFHKTMELLRNLARLNLIEKNDFEYRRFDGSSKPEDYKETSWKRIKDIAHRKKSRTIDIYFSPTKDNTHRGFIIGHWFNAYSYNIIYEHLFRNQFDFEIYSRVSYKSPTDVFHGSGDFDILALVNNKILMVECKFGKINERNLRSIQKGVIEKADRLKSVFDITSRKFEYVSILVYNNRIVNTNFLSDVFAGTDFYLIDIGDLRGSILDVFTDNKPEAIEKEVDNVKPIIEEKPSFWTFLRNIFSTKNKK